MNLEPKHPWPGEAAGYSTAGFDFIGTVDDVDVYYWPKYGDFVGQGPGPVLNDGWISYGYNGKSNQNFGFPESVLPFIQAYKKLRS